MKLEDAPAVLTVEEAAAILRIGRTAAYSQIREGRIPCVRLGRNIRVPRHQLERLLGVTDAGQNGGGEPPPP